jgi:probable F420-dependent oxidoreductase
LKVGVQLPEVEREVEWLELLAMAQAAERIGLDSVWVGDHLLYRYPGEPARGPWEAWSVLAALAAVTSRVELGPLVACLGFHNPAILAKKAATVDAISGGRLVLGVGAGWHRPEYDAFGVPFDHRASRFEEAFTILRELLRTGASVFHGTYYSVDDCVLQPRGPRPAGPPLVVGSFGDRILRFTLPHVDGWNAWFADYGNTREGLVALLAKIDAACEAVGRDPATLEKSIAPSVRMRGGVGRPGGDPAEREIPPISGEPERLAATLRDYAELGIRHVQLVLDPITVASIEALGPMLEMLDAGA